MAVQRTAYFQRLQQGQKQTAYLVTLRKANEELKELDARAYSAVEFEEILPRQTDTFVDSVRWTRYDAGGQ